MPARRSKQQLGNPVHHIHDGKLPTGALPVTFGLLLNLVGVMARRDARSRSGAISRNYVPDATRGGHPELDRLIDYALAYSRDFVAPTLQRRAPEGVEVAALRAARRRARRAARRCERGGDPEHRL